MPVLLSSNENPVKTAKGFDNSNDDIPPLCICFDGCCAPGGLFCSLVAHLLQSESWKLSMSSNTPSCCYRNCVAFVYDLQTTVTLLDSFSHFRVYIHSCHTFPYIIKEKISNSIETIVKRLSFNDMKYCDAIECPAHPEEYNHVAVWHQSPHDLYECKRENRKTGQIDQRYYVWKKPPGTSGYSVFIITFISS